MSKLPADPEGRVEYLQETADLVQLTINDLENARDDDMEWGPRRVGINRALRSLYILKERLAEIKDGLQSDRPGQ